MAGESNTAVQHTVAVQNDEKAILAQELARSDHSSNNDGLPITFDPAAERRLRRKIDWMVVPTVAMVYLWTFIDRANIGNAQIAGFSTDLGLKGYQYNIVLTSFYISYIIFEIPCNILCKKVGPGWFLPFLTLCFGIISFGTAFVHDFSSVCGVRFLLGIFEAGMLPGIAYYLSRWYTRSELTFRLALYIVMAPIAGAFGGLLASGILKLDSVGSVRSWRMIFLIEGIITCVVALISFVTLTDRPETAKWLSPEEKKLAIDRVRVQRIGGEVLDKMDLAKLKQGMFNPVTLGVSTIFLFDNITVQGLAFFLPTIVRTIYPRETVIYQQLWTVPPYVVGAFITTVIPYLSWKMDRRQIFFIISAPLIMIGYIIFLATTNSRARYGATFLITSGAFSFGSLSNAQVSANVNSDTARVTAIGMNVLFGNGGGLAATWSFLPFDGPNYPIGNGLNLATSTCILILSVALYFWMVRDNRKRDAKESKSSPSALSISGSRLTTKWIEGSDLEQIVELSVKNDDDNVALTWRDTFKIAVESESLDTVTPGKLIRLGPGQTTVVQIGVKNKSGVSAGSDCSAVAVATWGGSKSAKEDFSGLRGIKTYEATHDSVTSHSIPDWFREAKFGIFIHWGIYAAPAYGAEPGPNQDYSEWYWFRMNQQGFKTNTYEYHRDTYGESFHYDDFMSNFTDARFDPKEWVDAIADVGAKYFVPVTKHHDGWSFFIYPETINRRSLVHYGFKRDVLKELFDVAKSDHPEIRRATYFSMPEWYNPAYVKYGWDQQWLGNYYGRDPTNPYTGEAIPYTGHVEVNDFLDDIQNPQIESLFYGYGTDMLWCDIGGPNKVAEVLGPWFNWARDQGRQVSFNDRCGIPGDFQTPEYTGNNFSPDSFEGNRGMDPYSFGFNYMTKDEDYMSDGEIVIDLLNTVANNGNLLLNIGPKNDGSFPETEKNNLLQAGEWIRGHGEAIYSTRYWSAAQINGAYRYLTKPDAFYVHHVGQPSSQLVFTDRIPWVEGDVVTVLGGSANGEVVNVSKDSDGNVVFDLPEAAVNGDKWAWTFKIAYAQG